MDNDQKKDIIDGKIVNWDNLSLKELEEIREKVNKNIHELLKQIDKEVSIEE